MMQFQPSASLKSRTFIGLLLAQFTATFNDQTIHIVAIFYASDMLVRYVGLKYIDEKAVVSIVTACFITPFLLFSSYAGILADKFSKRTVIVFWKLAEVAMMSLALLGLSLPHCAAWGWAEPQTLATWSAVLVVSTVFMMGTHSAFFVPAKYGAMPEILHPTALSRGNGLLEGTSFTAQIFGTSAGGILYALLKSKVEPGGLVPGNEWVIGVLLVLLAGIGTFTAILMERIPVAAPDRKLSWNWWRPLQANLSILRGSKPLILAVLGIACAAYMTLFLRQTLLYEGEIGKELQAVQAAASADRVQHASPRTAAASDWSQFLPELLASLGSATQQSELRVALLIALVGFGVGIGSLLAGYLSGERIELGLVPLGGAFLVLLSFLLGFLMHHVWAVAVCLFLIGAFAGFYFVPLYALMQHRAPKDSKGNVIAVSNFLNVVGGILAVALFYFLTFGLESAFGPSLKMKDVIADPALRPTYIAQLERQMVVPQLLFLATSLFVAGVLLVLHHRLPDFFVRCGIWLSRVGRGRLRVIGLENLPGDGPVILVTNCVRFAETLDVITATDRFTRVILMEEPRQREPSAWLRLLARRSGLIALDPSAATPADWERALAGGLQTLERNDIVAISVAGTAAAADVSRLLQECQSRSRARVVPVFWGRDDSPPATKNSRIAIGPAVTSPITWDEARTAVEHLANVTHDARRTFV